MIVSMIAAVAENQVIGKNNDLVWNLPDDLKYFMDTTKGHHIITGRRNYESIPKQFRPLKNRINIIITRQDNFVAPGAIIVHNLKNALDIARDAGEEEAFIIGGGQIYSIGLHVSERLYITEINESFDGDTYFPDIDFSKWKEVSRIYHGTNIRHLQSFYFVIYERI